MRTSCWILPSCLLSVLYRRYAEAIRIAAATILLLALASPGSCESWFASVNTWSIVRESTTVGLEMDGSVSGCITQVDVTPAGLRVQGYHSSSHSLELNDVSMEDRTSAGEGELEIGESLYLRAAAIEEVTRNITKEYGSPEYVFDFHELWPVILSSTRDLKYHGSGISERERASNNQDFLQSSGLYSTHLEKGSSRYMELERMNVTVVAVGSSVESVDFRPTKTTHYSITENLTGISDIRYIRIGPDQETAQERIDERLAGTLRISTAIDASSSQAVREPEECWMGCDPARP